MTDPSFTVDQYGATYELTEKGWVKTVEGSKPGLNWPDRLLVACVILALAVIVVLTVVYAATAPAK